MVSARLSLQSTCLLVAVVAVDLVLARQFLRPVFLKEEMHHPNIEFPLLGMANVLLVAAYRLGSRPAEQPRLATFVPCGIVTWTCAAAFCWAFPYLIGLINDLWSDFYFWHANAGQIRYPVRVLTYHGVVALTGTLVLTTIAGLLTVFIRLVARGKASWFAAVTVVVGLMVAGSLRLKWLEYREEAIRHEETCTILRQEASAIRAELAKIGRLGPPTDRMATEIQTLEKELAAREVGLTRQRRFLEKYQHAMSRPWLPVEP